MLRACFCQAFVCRVAVLMFHFRMPLSFLMCHVTLISVISLYLVKFTVYSIRVKFQLELFALAEGKRRTNYVKIRTNY